MAKGKTLKNCQQDSEKRKKGALARMHKNQDSFLISPFFCLFFFFFKKKQPCYCFPGGSNGKKCACNAGGLGSIPGLGRSPGEGNRNPLQYSCLENPMDRRAWQSTVHGVAKSRTALSN